MTTPCGEVDRIDGACSGALPEMYLVVRARASDTAQSLARVKEIMRLVANHSHGSWPSTAEWRQQLPAWFVLAFDPEVSSRYDPDPWDLDSWLYSMEERAWRWWSSTADEETITATVWLVEWPYSIDALVWLVQVASETGSVSLGEFGVPIRLVQ
jgi:hypothetical protein